MTAVGTRAEAALTLAARAHHLARPAAEDPRFVARLADTPLVLLGEASHGTQEFYAERAAITRRLIEHHGMTAIAIEGDWPDAYRVNRYVLGQSDEPDAEHALRGFRRFPTWMWRNREVLDFVTWLRAHNDACAPNERVRFYGLDLYSLAASMEAVVGYLEKIDPAEAAPRRARYACFDRFGGPEGQSYGYALATQRAIPCEEEVVFQLVELRARTADYLRRDGMDAFDEAFFAEQNAVVVRDAEEYYQQMYRADVSSWNLRDRHMANTADALLEHLGHHHAHPKLAIWEHNSHVGDARATEMSRRGELNVGQLVRQRYSGRTKLVGFTTNSGEVTAARDWGAVAERRQVRPARDDSHEGLLRAAGVEHAWFDCEDPVVSTVFSQPRLERAIGVIYRPETERESHYFVADLASQFDLLVHIDRTHAVEPLEPGVPWSRGEPAETYPTGI